jgi:hypothetical protein
VSPLCCGRRPAGRGAPLASPAPPWALPGWRGEGSRPPQARGSSASPLRVTPPSRLPRTKARDLKDLALLAERRVRTEREPTAAVCDPEPLAPRLSDGASNDFPSQLPRVGMYRDPERLKPGARPSERGAKGGSRPPRRACGQTLRPPRGSGGGAPKLPSVGSLRPESSAIGSRFRGVRPRAHKAHAGGRSVGGSVVRASLYWSERGPVSCSAWPPGAPEAYFCGYIAPLHMGACTREDLSAGDALLRGARPAFPLGFHRPPVFFAET